MRNFKYFENVNDGRLYVYGKTEDLKQIFKSIIRKRIKDSENCPFRFRSFGVLEDEFYSSNPALEYFNQITTKFGLQYSNAAIITLDPKSYVISVITSDIFDIFLSKGFFEEITKLEFDYQKFIDKQYSKSYERAEKLVDYGIAHRIEDGSICFTTENIFGRKYNATINDDGKGIFLKEQRNDSLSIIMADQFWLSDAGMLTDPRCAATMFVDVPVVKESIGL